MPPTASASHLLSERARTVRPSAVRDLLRLTEQPEVPSLAGGLPASELLPTARISTAIGRVLDSAIARLADAFDTVAPHADRQCQLTAT